MREIKEKFREALSSILPIASIMFIATIVLGFPIQTTISIVVSTILLIVGVTLFTYGADLSMVIIGNKIGKDLVKSKKLWIILIVSFIIGTVVTVAEPDLLVLCEQFTSIPSIILILTISLGVGFCLLLASLRTLFGWDLNKILLILITINIIIFYIL